MNIVKRYRNNIIKAMYSKACDEAKDDYFMFRITRTQKDVSKRTEELLSKHIKQID